MNVTTYLPTVSLFIFCNFPVLCSIPVREKALAASIALLERSTEPLNGSLLDTPFVIATAMYEIRNWGEVTRNFSLSPSFATAAVAGAGGGVFYPKNFESVRAMRLCVVPASASSSSSAEEGSRGLGAGHEEGGTPSPLLAHNPATGLSYPFVNVEFRSQILAAARLVLFWLQITISFSHSSSLAPNEFWLLHSFLFCILKFPLLIITSRRANSCRV